MPRNSCVGRRAFLAAASAWPIAAAAQGQSAKADPGLLTIGLDIIDTATFDPARQVNYSPAMTLAACYDRLVTMTPGHYDTVVPALASAWAPTPDNAGWRFTLRPDATFASGNRVTPEDCAFSLNRVIATGAAPAHYVPITAVVPSGPDTVDVLLDGPIVPLLAALASPTFGIVEQAALSQAGAADWLDRHSAGSGAYVLAGWDRRQAIRLEANPHAWRDPPRFAAVLLRHIPDSAAQLRALQRGDIDAAFNLLPEHLAQLQTDANVRIESSRSLDLVFLALNGDAERNKALAQRAARQAVGFAIDYDDVLGRMLGGTAVRPASFLPVGLPGSGETTVGEIGYRQDLALAAQLMTQAGVSDGFTFDLSYSDSGIAGLSFDVLARKLRADLARVGITVRLAPMNPYSFRDAFTSGKTQAALSFWSSPVMDSYFYAQASLDRLAKRVGMVPPTSLTELVARAGAETDAGLQRGLWVDYQKAMLSQANLLALFQPSYQVAVRDRVAALPLTGAGWMAELGAARPRSPAPG